MFLGAMLGFHTGLVVNGPGMGMWEWFKCPVIEASALGSCPGGTPQSQQSWYTKSHKKDGIGDAV